MRAEDGQLSLEEVSDEYQAFVDKFKPKKTTDDCYTPENIFEAVAGWVSREYGADPARFVRPFWPGANYRTQEYKPGDIVVDNPPFSILSQIIGFYDTRRIPFFLFGPALTIFSSYSPGRRICYLCTGAGITYANGANIPTSFVTNLEADGTLIRSTPDLCVLLDAENQKNLKAMKKELPKYEYPDDVITASKIQWYSHHGTDFRVKQNQAVFIRGMDDQVKFGKACFGGGFLLSKKAAAEKAAAEKAAAVRWNLSEREIEIQNKLN